MVGKKLDGVTQTFYGRVVKSAKIRGIDVEVSLTELQDIFESQGQRCAYSGIPLKYFRSNDYNFSLDRLDASGHYSRENCRFVYKPINPMKWTLTSAEFLYHIESILHSYPGPLIDLNDQEGRRPQWRGAGPITGEWFGRVQRNARLRGIDFEVTIEDIYELFQSQGGRCSYTSWPLVFADYSAGRRGTASVDRIDSSFGYIKNNIQLVHKNINFMKGSMREPEFFSLVESVFYWSVVLGQPNMKREGNHGNVFFI